MRSARATDGGAAEDRPRGRFGLPWLGLLFWIVLLLAVDMTSRTVGLRRREVVYLVAMSVATMAVVTLIAFIRLAESPPELRTLRVMAVLLPSAFVMSIELILYFVEVEGAVSEVGEHIVATAILSAGAVPFSVLVFRTFTRLRNELARRAQNLQTLHETSLSVTGEPALPRLYELIAGGAGAVVAADRAILLLAPERGGAETVVAAPSGSPGPGELELARAVAETGRARRAVADGRACLGVALRRRGSPVGAVVAASDADHAFGVEEELTLEMFAVAASAGIENAHRLEEAQLLATVEERERIARDLHDDLGQLLGFLTAKIQAAQELVATGRDTQARRELAGLEQATRMLGGQVREAILGLRARVGPDRWLGHALEEYVADFGIQAGLGTVFEGRADAGRDLPGPSQYQLLRVAQEALSNARRHARARSVTVHLEESDGGLELSVADDGEGFVPEDARPGFGLKTMAERVRSLGGAFEVRSAPGSGTVVSVRVPVNGG